MGEFGLGLFVDIFGYLFGCFILDFIGNYCLVRSIVEVDDN